MHQLKGMAEKEWMDLTPKCLQVGNTTNTKTPKGKKFSVSVHFLL